MKIPKTLPSAEELDARLSAITTAPGARGWKTEFLDQNQRRILTALQKHSYEQVAAALRDCKVNISAATLANWRKRLRTSAAPTVAATDAAKPTRSIERTKRSIDAADPVATASLFSQP